MFECDQTTVQTCSVCHPLGQKKYRVVGENTSIILMVWLVDICKFALEETTVISSSRLLKIEEIESLNIYEYPNNSKVSMYQNIGCQMVYRPCKSTNYLKSPPQV